MLENFAKEFNLLKEYIDYFTDKNVELHKKYSDYCLNEMIKESRRDEIVGLRKIYPDYYVNEIIKTRFNKPVSFEDWKKLYGWGEPLSFENWKRFYSYER
jgi:hypothetical protein